MKKIGLTITIMILIFLLMVGCFSESSPEQSEQTAETQSVQPTETTELRVVANAPGKAIVINGAGTENGYYDYINWNAEMYQSESESPYTHIANLTYTDYETGVRTYLCSVPGCQHNNESCTSFIRYSYGLSLFTNSDNTALFCATLNLPSKGEIIDDSDFSRIYRMDMDGSNRTEILKLDANQSFRTYSYDAIIADKDNIYITVTTVEDATAAPKREYVKLDINTGEVEVLFELDSLETGYSAFGDTIGIYNSQFKKTPSNGLSVEEQRDFELSELPNEEKSGITSFGYSLNDKTKDKLYEWTTLNGTMIGNYHFAVAKTSADIGSLIVVDIETGEKKIIENIPANSAGAISLHDFYDNKIIWGYTSRSNLEEIGTNDKDLVNSDNRKMNYIIDIDTGEVSEFTLKYDEGTEQENHVHIVHATEDSFLVSMDIDRNSTIDMTDREGITQSYPITRSIRALIDKDDYYNSIPNYRIIEDLI